MDSGILQDLQYTVLGSMLRYPDAIGPAMAELAQEDFPIPGCQGVYLAIRKLFLAGEPVNLLSVSAEAGELFANYVQTAMLAPAEPDVSYYVKKLREVSRLTALQRAGAELAGAEDQQEADRIISRINALCAQKRGMRVATLQEAIRAYREGLGKEKPAFIPTGLPELDREVFLRPGKLFVLGGYPSSGKTLLSLLMAKEMGKGRRVGYFSCETLIGDLTTRILAAQSRVWNRRLITGDLNAADLAALDLAERGLADTCLELVESSGATAEDVRAMALSRRYDVVFVDYLQLLKAPGASPYDRVSNVSMALADLARGSHRLVVALAQLSRAETTKKGEKVPPTMSSFRESGQIEQDADVAALIWPEDDGNNGSDRVLKIAKNKEGERVTLSLAFDGGTQTMTVKNKPSAWWEIRQKVKAAEGSGFMVLPEGAAEVPESFRQEKLAF